MGDFKKWIMMISAVSVFSGIVSSLLSENSYKKVFSFVVGSVLVYTLLQPFVGKNSVDFHISDYLKFNYEISENIDIYAEKSMIQSAEKAIEDIFYDFADSNGINCEISCECIVSDNKMCIDEIYISDCKTEENINLIREYAIKSGFDESIIYFTGD